MAGDVLKVVRRADQSLQSLQRETLDRIHLSTDAIALARVICATLLVLYVSQKLWLPLWRTLRVKGILGTLLLPWDFVRALAIRVFLSLPMAKSRIDREIGELRSKLVSDVVDKPQARAGLASLTCLPPHGHSREWLVKQWTAMRGMEARDEVEGKGGEELGDIITEAMRTFLLSNPLHADVFPSTRKMESEIVKICLDLFNCPNGAGTTTSGGTESILMAVKTYRDWARVTKGITNPEMIVPSSAHAAFWKASQYFGIKLHVIPIEERSRKANVRWMNRAINSNTIMIVGSAPNFPDGMVDDIPALAQIARRHGIGLHVDCCLGSFLMPFLDRCGYGDGVPPFDFRVDGVTSISCDIHKYGFCPKGVSIIMYHSAQLRRYQFYVITDWAGGVYASPTMAGSRPGMILAGAWAVLNHIGQDGYTESCQKIVGAARSFTTSLRSRLSEDLYVLGDPKISVVAFGSKTVDIYAVGDAMRKKGWHLNALANPPALHMAFTMPTSETGDQLLDDLEMVIKEVKKSPTGDNGDMVALYGVGQTSVGPHVVEELAKTYIDVLYE